MAYTTRIVGVPYTHQVFQSLLHALLSSRDLNTNKMPKNAASSIQSTAGQPTGINTAQQIQSFLANRPSRTSFVLSLSAAWLISITGETIMPQSPSAVQAGYYVRPDGIVIYIGHQGLQNTGSSSGSADKWSTDCQADQEGTSGQ